MNLYSVKVLYFYEMKRFFKTSFQSIASPVISTSLYFVVFGSAIGSRIESVDGISYGMFIVPGMVIFSLLTQSISNASFGIFFPRFSGTIYEVLSAPMSSFEIILGYVGAAATKSFFIGIVILITASFFIDFNVMHPFLMVLFLITTCITFSLFGFIIGVLASNFEGLQIIPMIIITPLIFLGGSFYSVNMLPEFWRNISLFNPVLYLVSGFRWSFFGIGDVDPSLSVMLILVFLSICCFAIWLIFKTGYRIKS